MTNSYRESLLLFLIGAFAFLGLGVAFCLADPGHMDDFRAVYYPTRCLMSHRDPYSRSEVQKVYVEQGGERADPRAENNQIASQSPYPPTVFPFILPFAALPWRIAQLAWSTINIGSFLLACFVLWHAAARFAPDIAGFLFFLLLLNGQSLIVAGNVAALVVGFCAISIWCFLRERFVPAGIICLTVALALKPQDAGQIWLCLLLCGGIYRKRAMQVFWLFLVFCLPAVLWVWGVSPHWIQEWHANILAFSGRGGINDPGPGTRGGGIDMLISLQTIFSTLWDNPRFYNAASYLASAPLLIAWAVACLRSRPSPEKLWMCLAIIAPLSMLPVYHRELDATLMLICVPACAMLWARRDRIAKFTLAISAAGFLVIGFLPWLVLFHFIQRSHLHNGIKRAIETLPTPSILLTMSLFFLWVFWKMSSHPTLSQPVENGSAKQLA